VRARLGYVWGNGEVISYVTGGLAYGRVGINGTSAPIGVAVVNQAFSQSKINTGWVLGWETEGRLATPGWTWKVENLYMDLGTLDASQD
jgi:outer membrane immunogenic protein